MKATHSSLLEFLWCLVKNALTTGIPGLMGNYFNNELLWIIILKKLPKMLSLYRLILDYLPFYSLRHDSILSIFGVMTKQQIEGHYYCMGSGRQNHIFFFTSLRHLLNQSINQENNWNESTMKIISNASPTFCCKLVPSSTLILHKRGINQGTVARWIHNPGEPGSSLSPTRGNFPILPHLCLPLISWHYCLIRRKA